MRLTAGCAARGASRVHLTNSCFRMPGTLAVVADRRGGEFADDLYLVMWDNRNGTRVNTNGDVFFFTSKDGGSTWIGPTRVNDDPSTRSEEHTSELLSRQYLVCRLLLGKKKARIDLVEDDTHGPNTVTLGITDKTQMG